MNGFSSSLSGLNDEALDDWLSESLLGHKSNRRVLTQGIINTYQNRIEIWFAGKKIHKTTIGDIAPPGLLFPLFALRERQLKIKGMLVKFI